MTGRVVLVHGATGDPSTFDPWLPRLDGLHVRVPDLQEGLDVAHATTADYVRAVRAEQGDGPVVVVGFSMGGLVAMRAVEPGARRPTADVRGLVLLEPSVPLEVGGGDADVVPVPGTYGAEVYGGTGGRPESAFARAERQRGVSVPDVDVPLLVVGGADHTHDRSRPVARRYGGELVTFRLRHGALVTDAAAVDVVVRWVRRALDGAAG